MTLPADWAVFAFFRADSPISVHCFDCSFVSGVVWWTHVSSMVIKSMQNISFIAVKHRQTHDWNILTMQSFFFVSKRGTHLAHSFLKSKFSVNMRFTALFEMPTMSASLRTIKSTVIQYHFVDFVHYFCRGHLIWSTTAMLVLAVGTTSSGLFLMEWLIDYENRMESDRAANLCCPFKLP